MRAINIKKNPALVWGNTKTKLFEFVLRIGVACTFLGHGMLALNVNPKWVSLITSFGFQENTAQLLLPLIGYMDIILALVLLLYPIRVVVIWAIIWPFTAALSYLVSGQPIWEFIERASNWILPLALLWLLDFPKKWNELLTR